MNASSRPQPTPAATLRRYSAADRLLIGLRARLAGRAADEDVPLPPEAARAPHQALDDDARRHAAGLMRVNHAGEVAAQALYQGQALVARNPELREHLLKAAAEERAHLSWCKRRLGELGERPSRLGPLWYVGSFTMGALAGLAGDRWSLGFVAETETQVAEHLDDHLRRLPEADQRGREVVKAMRRDEVRHGDEATERGGAPLPGPVKFLMRGIAGVMKAVAYRV